MLANITCGQSHEAVFMDISDPKKGWNFLQAVYQETALKNYPYLVIENCVKASPNLCLSAALKHRIAQLLMCLPSPGCGEFHHFDSWY